MILEIPAKIYDRLVKDMQGITILVFIKDNANDRGGLSKERVAKAMYEKGICSRPTTLKIIDSLLDQEILLEQGRGFRNSSDLVINEDFPYERMMKQSFAEYKKKLEKEAEPFKSFMDKDKGKRIITLDLD